MIRFSDFKEKKKVQRSARNSQSLMLMEEDSPNSFVGPWVSNPQEY